MPVVIEQTFPLGRYHATRWNQNPFEDRFGEWPPSPWRMVRTLAARWFQYLRETADDRQDLRDEVLVALAGQLPSFRLPIQTWRGRELRQYQPTALELQYKYKKSARTGKNEVEYSFRQVSTTLALDGYHAVPRTEALYWIWSSCDLSPDATGLLRQLLRRIHYFGRAETWTSMGLVGVSNHVSEPNCKLSETPSSGAVPVLAHHPGHALDIEQLLSSTEDRRLSHRRIPEGTAWFYANLPERLSVHAWQPRRTGERPRIHGVRYALDSTVLPLVTETLPVAEAARRALMSIHGRVTENNGVRGRSNVFSGKDEHGQPLAGHRHAYYLPTEEDGDDRLNHLTVHAAGGFGPDELRSFDGLHELRTGREGEERHPLRLLLMGMGALDEYGPGPLRTSEVWVSATPYIATRYAKTRGRDRIDMASPEARGAFLQDDLRAQLAAVRPELAGEGAPMVTVEPLWDDNQVFKIAGRWRTIQFNRFRRKAGDDGGRRLAGAFRLTFSRPVRGPIALGWSSHFGMGLFVLDPAREGKSRGR